MLTLYKHLLEMMKWDNNAFMHMSTHKNIHIFRYNTCIKLGTNLIKPEHTQIQEIWYIFPMLLYLMTPKSKSKAANIWKFLQIFINRLFYNGLCLTVPLLFIIYLFFFCVWFLSVLLLLVSMYLMVLSCIGGQVWTSYMLTDCVPSYCIKNTFEEYILTY